MFDICTETIRGSGPGMRPKDGSKNKVCLAIHDCNVSTLGVTHDYESKVLGSDLNTLPALVKAREVAGSENHNTPVDLRRIFLAPASFHLDQLGLNCTWYPNPYDPTILTCNIHSGGPISRGTELDFLHAVAHLLCPGNLALHGFEFVTIFLDLVEKFGYNGKTGASAKKEVKATFIERKIKTFKRTRPTKTTEQIIAELMAIHEKL